MKYSKTTVGSGILAVFLLVTLVTGGVGSAAPNGTATGPSQNNTTVTVTTPAITPSSNQSTNTTQQPQNNSSISPGWVIATGPGAINTTRDIINGTANFVKDPIGTATDTASDIYKGSMKAILGPLVTVIVEVPTFGIGLQDGTPGIHNPTKWPFDQLLPLYIAIQAFTGVVLLMAIGVSFLKIGVPTRNTFRATQTGVRVVKALFIAVVFHLLIIAILHTTVNEIALAIAPTPSELSGDLVKILTTTVLAGVLGGGMGKAVIISLIKLWTLIWAGLMFFPIISGPFFALWQMQPDSTFGRLSGTLIWLYFGLLISKIIVAVDLRAAWMLDWGAGMLGPLNILVTIGLFMLAFLIPPAVLIAILFTRSKAMSNLASWTGGAVAGSYFGRKATAKGRQVKEATHDRFEGKGSEYKDRATKRARTTATSTKQRVKAAAGRHSGGRVGRNPRDQRYSGGESYRSWTEHDTTNGDETTTTDSTASTSEESDNDDSTASTQTTAQQVRDLEGRGRDRGHPTPGERQRYYNLQDEQKYDDQFRERKKSTTRRSAERRYAYSNRGAGGLHSDRTTTTTSQSSSERTSHPEDAPLGHSSAVHHQHDETTTQQQDRGEE